MAGTWGWGVMGGGGLRGVGVGWGGGGWMGGGVGWSGGCRGVGKLDALIQC